MVKYVDQTAFARAQNLFLGLGRKEEESHVGGRFADNGKRKRNGTGKILISRGTQEGIESTPEPLLPRNKVKKPTEWWMAISGSAKRGQGKKESRMLVGFSILRTERNPRTYGPLNRQRNSLTGRF